LKKGQVCFEQENCPFREISAERKKGRVQDEIGPEKIQLYSHRLIDAVLFLHKKSSNSFAGNGLIGVSIARGEGKFVLLQLAF